MPKRSSIGKRRSKALPALGFAGMSLSIASGACASTSEASANTSPSPQKHEIFLGEEEISADNHGKRRDQKLLCFCFLVVRIRGQMRRFTLASPVLAVLLFVFASITTAHAAQRIARIGVLCAPSCSVATMAAFWDELQKTGWIEGTNILVERKEAGAHIDQFPALAAELVQLNPDLIVATNPQSARAARDVTSKIPIAFFGVAG